MVHIFRFPSQFRALKSSPSTCLSRQRRLRTDWFLCWFLTSDVLLPWSMDELWFEGTWTLCSLDSSLEFVPLLVYPTPEKEREVFSPTTTKRANTYMICSEEEKKKKKRSISCPTALHRHHKAIRIKHTLTLIISTSWSTPLSPGKIGCPSSSSASTQPADQMSMFAV